MITDSMNVFYENLVFIKDKSQHIFYYFSIYVHIYFKKKIWRFKRLSNNYEQIFKIKKVDI